MQNLTITPAQLVSLATAVHAASTDDITPTITGIRLIRDGAVIRAIATDRYRVARITLTIGTGVEHVNDSAEFDVLAHGKSLDILARGILRAATRRNADMPSVRLEHDDDARRLTVVSEFGRSSATVPVVIGNYPPVERLIPSAELMTGSCEPVALKAAFLASMSKLSTPSQDREAAWTMHRQPDEGNKPKPVLFTIGNDAERIEYLIQPNLKLR